MGIPGTFKGDSLKINYTYSVKFVVSISMEDYVWDNDWRTREFRIDEAASWGDSDSLMTSFDVILPLKLQSTMKIRENE